MLKLESTDQWGMYRVGDRAFLSKLEAVQYSRRINAAVSWHYQEDEFVKHDWTQEPTQSIWELYSQRALHLREKYNYLMLLYSGGADSTNVLEAFDRNGIMVDEIYIAYNGDFNNTENLKFWNNLELYHEAIPRARKLQERWPNLKITVGRMDQAIVEHLESTVSDELYYGHNMRWNLIQTTRCGMLWTERAEWIPKVSGDQSIGIILGKDKTPVNNRGGRYCVEFNDVMLNPSFDPLPDNITREYFYWSKDCVPLMIKQGHVIKKFFRQADNNPDWFEQNKKWFTKGKHRRWLWYELPIAGRHTSVNNACYNTLVYPYYDPTIFDIGKLIWQTKCQSTDRLLNQNLQIKEKFNQHVQNYAELYGRDWLYDVPGVDPLQYGVKACYSKPWFLEK
jgi:hypothetical protein